jgi:hypothetical protein
MSARAPLPLALRLVALLFLLGGISSVLNIVVCALNNRLQLDFGVVGILVYFGLLRLSSGWRTCALVLIWIGIIGAITISIIAMLSFGLARANINFFGIPGPETPPFFVFIPACFWLALALWQLSVLKRPDIMALFIRKEISRF